MKVTKRQLKRIIKEEKARLLMETMIEWEAYPEVGDAVFDFSEELTELIVALGARTRGWDHSHVDRVVTDHLFSAMSDIATELGLSYED